MQFFNPLLKSNLERISVGSYSAIIYKSGTNTIAEDSSGKKISVNADSSTVINAAIASQSGGVILIKEGNYYLYSEILINKNFISLEGEFRHAVHLYIDTDINNGINATGDYISIKNFDIRTSVVKTAGAAIYTNGVFEMTIRDIFITDHFIGIHHVDTTIFYLENVTIVSTIPSTGIGIIIDGGNDAFLNHVFLDNPAGSQPLYGIYIVKHGGGWFSDIDCIHCGTYGINIGGPLAGFTVGIVEWLFFSQVSSDSNNNAALNFQASSNGAILRGIYFDNCWFCTSLAFRGIRSTSGGGGIVEGINFSNCRVFNNYTDGFLIGNGLKNISIDNCLISQNNVSNAAGGSGLNIAASSTNISVSNNTIGTGFDSFSANLQTYGIAIQGNPQDKISIIGNDLTGNVSSAIWSPLGLNLLNITNGIVRDNRGYNPQALAGIAVGASPFTYTNTSGSVEQIHYVMAGVSATTFNRAGVNTALTISAGHIVTITLYPGDGLTITYALGPPILIRIPM